MKKNLKRILSLALSLCLVMSIAIFQGSFIAGAVSVKQPDVTMGDLKFVVPEVIYLYPNAQSASTTTTTPFQYYVNNTADGNVVPNAPLETTGKIYFSYGGTLSGDITYDFYDESLSSGLSGTVTLSASNILNGGSVNIVSGKSPSLAASVNGCYLRWCVTYVDSIDGLTKKAYAYSYVYKPYVVPAASGADGGTGLTTKSWAGAVTWISGGHSLTEGASIAASDWDETAYLYTDMNGFSAFISTNPTGYVGNNAVNGSQAKITSNFTAKHQNATLGYTVFSNSGSTGYYLKVPSNSNPTTFGTGSKSSTTSPVKNLEVGKYYKNTKNIQACMYSSTYANLYIDTSRYSNLNQIPNLGVGLIVSDDEHSDSNSGTWYIADFTGRSVSGYTTWHKDADNRGAYYSDHGDIIASQGSSATDCNYSETEGVFYAGTWPRTLQGNTNSQGATQMYMVKGFYGNKDGDYYESSHTVARMQATYYNKATLRTAVNNATAKMAALGVNGVSAGATITSAYFEANTSYKWTTLQNAYKEAVIGLTKLNSTSNPNTLATNLNNALNELATRVSFSGNGGTLSGTTSAYVAIGTNPSVTFDSPCTASRSGYTFIGWNTDKDATTGTSRVTAGYNTTVYAIWAKNISAKFWRLNGSLTTAETVTATLYSSETSAQVTASQPPLTANYDGRVLNWLGFTTEDTANASTEVSTTLVRTISGGENFNSLYSGNVTLKFNANGGNGAPSQQTQKQYLNANETGVTGTGVSFTIPTNEPNKTGNTFLGWAFDSTATIADYQAGQTVDGVNVNTELFAVWQPNTYYVKYNRNGGDDNVAMPNSTHHYGVPSPLTKNLFTKSYTVTYKSNDGRPDTTDTAVATFNGWATSSVGTVQYADEQVVTSLTKANEATVNLYANWTNGSVELPNITRKGYEFRGWYTNAALTNLAGGAGESYTPKTNVSLFASWDPNTYTVTYNGNGATGGATTRSTHTYGVEQPLSLNGFVKEYRVLFEYNEATGGERPLYLNVSSAFGGWAETADGPALYSDGEGVMNLAESGNVVLYATWGSGSIYLPAPEKTNHIFQGWYKDAEFTQFAGNAGAVFSTDVGTTLYAKWKEIDDPILVSAPGSTTVIDNDTDFIYGLPDRDIASANDLLTANFANITGGNGYVTYEYSNQDNVIGTGTKVSLYRADGHLIKTYTVIIFGDNDGDGYITMSDVTDASYYDALLDSTYDYEDLSVANVKAMDVNADGMVDQRDISIVTYYVTMLIDEIDQTGAGTILN